MPTHHPLPPPHPLLPERPMSPRRRVLSSTATRLVALSAVTVLANFSWTSTSHTHNSSAPGHGSAPGLGPDRDARDAGADIADPAALPGPDPDYDGQTGGDRASDDLLADDLVAADPVPDARDQDRNEGDGDDEQEDEETATARRFVTVALDGGFGEAHRLAAQTAVAVATEHDFAEDPKRVAEALVVFLHPDHR